MLKKAATDVVKGKSIVFPVTQAQEIRGLRISPFGVVKKKEKLRLSTTCRSVDRRPFGRDGERRDKERFGNRKVSR